MVSLPESYRTGKCALCERTRPLNADGLCRACAAWAAAVDRLAALPSDHPMWDRLLRDLGRS